MATNASIGFGTLFQIRDAALSPPDYVTVGEVTNITLPNLSRDAVDATHTESTGGWREFIPGLKDAGEVTIEMNFVYPSASDTLIRGQFASDELTLCKILFDGGASPEQGVQFSAIVTGYEIQTPLDDKKAATLTLKVSGPVTLLS
jgi:predicted secreted protein